MREIMLLVALIITPMLSISAPISRQINLSTEIDKNNFLEGGLSVRFTPDTLVTTFDRGTGVFRELDAKMSVISQLPTSEVNNGFSIFINENNVACFDSNNSAVNLTSTPDSDVYGFAKLSVDGISIPVSGSISIPEFNIINNGFYEGDYQVKISFNGLSASQLGRGACFGDISVRLELNI
ncbi:hypothetical protein [Aeromonas sp. FDAARGOS 1419]|uniref:hypothetical protein n=1 Tax=Aeromonas sp. FDAARGOS 1419 TaxID=2778068 RepID=UPI001C21742B|nr:hypothetical protein [Aeromonas sp. FDAARGOS 1419]QWZ78085.1 hypothetical protein I6L49_03635 [Aeromonas sp. FDAARGOS 1419]